MEPFDMLRYLEHLRRFWRIPAIACGIAVALALTLSLFTPSEYTATARIMIEPPAGSDLRSSMAVSPIYLESLKTYELLASGGRLFADAAEHFHLRRDSSIDRMKRSVLKVRIPHNTKILEISATLRDARQAQALALYIAEKTARLAREVSIETDRGLIEDAQKQWEEARARLEKAASIMGQGAAGDTAGHVARAEAAQAERDSARMALEAAEKHLSDVRSAAGYRGERLKIIDPGVVPERPSWPNIPLNICAALLIALLGAFVYVTFEFNYHTDRAVTPRAVAPLARVKSRND